MHEITALPLPRTPDPMEAPPLRWGVLAPGGIARRMVAALRLHTRQQVVAVGSRTLAHAQEFADEFGLERAYGSYEQLVADPDVQAVYIASPHSEHAGHALLGIAAGKHVLVEKSFTRNRAEAEQVAAAARRGGVALMEAMWTRFLPRTDIVRQLLLDGVLGDILTVQADHGQSLLHVPRMVRPDLAGGALLDLGIYPVSYAAFVLGLPDRVSASAELTPAGVDLQDVIALGGFPAHPQAMASLFTGMGALTPTSASIAGTLGRIELDGMFYTPGQVRLVGGDGTVLVSPPAPIGGHEGLCYEAVHFAQMVTDGQLESALLPVEESVGIMGLLDEVRRQTGVVYPGE